MAAEDGEVAEAVVAEVDSEDLVVEDLAVEVRGAVGEKQGTEIRDQGLGD